MAETAPATATVVDHCLTERRGSILIVTMNRPEARNALSPQMIVGLVDTWRLVNEDAGIRVVVLTGAGAVFSAGADLKTMGREKSAPPEVLRRLEEDPDITQKALLHTFQLNKPVVAAIEGPAVGGGTEILQSTDVRIAGASARFGLPEVRWGLFPLAGSTLRLRRQIAYTHAAELLLTGDIIDAERALQIGLIGRIVPDGQALACALEVAERIAGNGPLAIAAVKRSLIETEGRPESEAIAIGLAIGRPVFQTRDAYEGTAAFAEKRRPAFEGA